MTGRVNIASTDFVQKRHDVAVKFFEVLKNCIDWSYAHPEQSAKLYADINKISLDEANLGMQFYKKEQLQLTTIKGLDFAMDRAVKGGFIKAPLTKEQQDDLIDILVK